MLSKNQVIKLCVPFQKEINEQEDLHITGRASTNTEDRQGDIIATDAWKKKGALDNYLKNPVVLAYHDMSRPIGKTIEHKVDDVGLTVTAKISKAAGDIVELIKDGILSGFSVGFFIKDADFDPKSGVFMIKELELFEISVVSIPANQDALFSIEKNFSSPEEYQEFKQQFIKESEETLMKEVKDQGNSSETKIDVAGLAKEISSMVKSDLKAEQEAKEKAEAAAKEEIERLQATATTADERLIKDLRDELLEKDKTFTEALEGIRDALTANKDGIQEVYNAENKGKVKYVESSDERFKQLTTDQKDGMLYAARIKGVSIDQTDTFRNFAKKSGMEHWDAGVTGEWEDEYSTRVQDAMREQLVVEPLFSTIPMSTPTMNMPINPEAGFATWVHENAYRSDTAPWSRTGDGTDTSTGEAQEHQLNEQVMIARKLATREYVGYEEEEDSIVALAPVIRDAVSRRMAKASDLAILRGAGILTNTSVYDPITGLDSLAPAANDVSAPGGASWATNSAWSEDLFVDMRRNLGIYGIDPGALTLLVAHDVYYELIKLPNFKTVDVLGDKATIITGQVGSLFGMRVVVSQQFDNDAVATGTVGTTLAILVRPSNFLVGNLRGIMTEADRDVINQQRVIVSSRRFAFQTIIANAGLSRLEIAS